MEIEFDWQKYRFSMLVYGEAFTRFNDDMTVDVLTPLEMNNDNLFIDITTGKEIDL